MMKDQEEKKKIKIRIIMYNKPTIMVPERDIRNIEPNNVEENFVFRYGQWFQISVNTEFSGWSLNYRNTTKNFQAILTEENSGKEVEIAFNGVQYFMEPDYHGKWYTPAGPLEVATHFDNNGKIIYDPNTSAIEPYILVQNVDIRNARRYQIYVRYGENVFSADNAFIDKNEEKQSCNIEALYWKPLTVEDRSLLDEDPSSEVVLIPDNPEIISSLQFMINYI